MKIGLCGTMSVGKTTLVKVLAELELFKKYKIATERSKYLRDLGIPLNTDSTVNGQMVFLAERASELLHNDVITDRTVWDVSAFTMLAKSIDINYKSTLVNSSMMLKDQYDIVFYIDPIGTNVEDNGVRETDLEYRDKINQEILRLLALYPPKKMVVLRGSTADRMGIILDNIV
jgi:deoxyadenosine/deoxycytidine kinase